MNTTKKNIVILVLSVLCFVFVFLLAGCAGQHCIKIGGNYEGVQGDIEYCFDAKATEELKAPVIKGSDNVDFIGISKKEASEIIKENEAVEEGETKENFVKNLNDRQIKSIVSRLKKFLGKGQ